MESSESHEATYYEVALTNRQVLIAFVVLLTSVVAAFLAGVWIGRGESSVAHNSPGAAEPATSTLEAPLEQLTFFNGKDAGARVGKPPAAAAPAASGEAERAPATPRTEEAKAEDRATETMRQNLDATMAANRTAPASAPAASGPPPAGTRVQNKPAVPSTAPAKSVPTPAKETPTAKPAVAGRTFVQVYSSTNGVRAKEIVAELKKAGFPVAVAESPKNGGASYRVRVGPYADRAKADAAASRLRRQFRLETWVTDSP